jgi:hypothetical protein
MPYMTDQRPLGRPPRGASVPGGAPCGAGPQLIVAGPRPSTDTMTTVEKIFRYFQGLPASSSRVPEQPRKTDATPALGAKLGAKAAAPAKDTKAEKAAAPNAAPVAATS